MKSHLIWMDPENRRKTGVRVTRGTPEHNFPQAHQMNDGTEFFVEDVVGRRSGKFLVAGVPNNRKPIRIGDTFVVRYDVIRKLEDIQNELPPPDPVNLASLSLTVRAIETLRTSVDVLTPGVTGCLHLDGEGAELITQRCFLRTGS